MADDTPQVEEGQIQSDESPQAAGEPETQSNEQLPHDPQGDEPAVEDSPQGAEGELAADQGDQGDTGGSLEEARANEAAFSWQASEYVHHHKGAVWFLGLFAAVALLVGATALLHYWLEMGAIILMCGAIVVYATKPPRTLLYELTPKGVTIEGKFYPF